MLSLNHINDSLNNTVGKHEAKIKELENLLASQTAAQAE